MLVVMDGAMIGANSIIGATAFVKAGMQIPDYSLVVGRPLRSLKPSLTRISTRFAARKNISA